MRYLSTKIHPIRPPASLTLHTPAHYVALRFTTLRCRCAAPAAPATPTPPATHTHYTHPLHYVALPLQFARAHSVALRCVTVGAITSLRCVTVALLRCHCIKKILHQSKKLKISTTHMILEIMFTL